ncbi:glycoside hydrolase family 16 protein [Exilibacterium tricleocarpae]|uniref:Glycoside hydrolase family 16 protein n=2 Tax=Exilibacterium tricleocarpae TaxID=2591008 RepID=A0A545SLW6_9GAMM|nr:glycoside hydrolase family 16 protein [Exilibacterium tricleocarpae]
MIGLGGCDSDSDSGTAGNNPPPATPTESGWELVWSDEFDGTAIDTGNWSHEVNCAGGGNNELQCYTARTDNSFVEDGALHIVAREESYTGPALHDDDPDYDADDISANRNYTSARLRSKNKGDWTYGRLEIAAKLPQGQGIWPAVWMLPTEWRYGGWPLSGEIDIVEAVNTNAAGGNRVHGTLHYGRYWPANNYSGTDFEPDTNVWEAFHQYAVEWERDEIRWYVDGVHYATQRPATDTDVGWFTYFWQDQDGGFNFGERGAPFDEAFHLLLNLAIGGNWPGSPDADTQFPQTLEIDYVRVYRCSAGNDDGSGCASNVDSDITAIGSQRPQTTAFSLYQNGLQNLSLPHAGTDISQPLDIGFYDAGQAGRVVVDAALADAGNTVWQITFNGPGNSFINVAESAVPNAERGLKLLDMTRYGELRFDLKVLSADPDTQLTVKLDSGWPNLRQYTLALPEPGNWREVSVPFDRMQANPIEAGNVDFDSVLNPFVIEASGAAQIQLNNIRIVCLMDCALAPIATDPAAVISDSFTLYDDGTSALFAPGLGLWEETPGHVQISEIDATEVARGRVIDARFTSPSGNGLMFIQSGTNTKDLSAFADTGLLRFDVKVLDYNQASELILKVDCVHPCSSGDYSLGAPGAGNWETVDVAVSDLVAGGLDLGKVNTPFVLFPTWGAQGDVHLQIDNIRWLLP